MRKESRGELKGEYTTRPESEKNCTHPPLLLSLRVHEIDPITPPGTTLNLDLAGLSHTRRDNGEQAGAPFSPARVFSWGDNSEENTALRCPPGERATLSTPSHALDLPPLALIFIFLVQVGLHGGEEAGVSTVRRVVVDALLSPSPRSTFISARCVTPPRFVRTCDDLISHL